MSAHPHVTLAYQYIEDVLAGRRLACSWVQRACQRHMDDLERATDPTFPFTFNEKKAETSCRFAELLPHIKGRWAANNENIQLEPFQCFERSMIFGWVEKATGLRRFRTAYIERPRKNAKSTDAATMGLELFASDGEFGAEVYSGATNEKQAWEVFRPARLMAQRTPAFRDAFGVQVNAKSLTILENGSRFEPVIGKPGDGASPSCAIIDEYHEHADDSQLDTMVSGMGAREQPLALVITTAGTDIEGPCYALHERVENMLTGAIPEERLFGIIYTIDKEDDWTDPRSLEKANPNYGVSVSADFLLGELRVALNDSRKQNNFKTKHLNVWCSARSPWMNMEWWLRQADAELTLEQFTGERCWLGFDLANRIDLVAMAILFQRQLADGMHYYGFGRYYAPQATVEDPEKQHYQGWAHDGHLIATPGNDCDLDRILADTEDLRRTFQIQEAAIDPWNSIGLGGGLQKLNIEVVEVPQRVQFFSGPMKAMEAAVKDGRFHHDGNPCMNWMMGNVSVKVDANDNVFPRKERRDKKIDGPVAMIMDFGRAIVGAGKTAAFWAPPDWRESMQ